MNLRTRVWLDGQALHDLDPAIIITDVTESAPKVERSTAASALGWGSQLMQSTRRSLSVTVHFLIRDYSPAHRFAVLQKVHLWARGKALAVSYRPGQQLNVVADELPVLSSSLKWTGGLSITFTAYAMPYWQDAVPLRFTCEKGELLIPGTAPAAPADVIVTSTGSGMATTLTVHAGRSMITLQNISLPAGDSVAFSHDEYGRLSITRSGVSLLAHRTAASADALLVLPGCVNDLACSADQPVKGEFVIRGVWA